MLIVSSIGVAALGANYISVGIHTGTILLFRVSTVAASECPEAAAEATMSSFRCENVDSQRCHVFPITDLASTSTISNESKEVISTDYSFYSFKNCKIKEFHGYYIAVFDI